MSENLVSCWARKVEKSVKLYKVDRRKRKSATPCHPTFLPWVVSVLSNFLSQGSERMKSFCLPKTKTERGVRLGSIKGTENQHRALREGRRVLPRRRIQSRRWQRSAAEQRWLWLGGAQKSSVLFAGDQEVDGCPWACFALHSSVPRELGYHLVSE